ncbi:hypothetical protein I7I50_09271 [Histoplasma capsulatum G186AR]|uniref:Uncharacterized protein n=1 Tax=Ajellomyces capsulatus TaxID=5037 RepID=A0A8H7YPP8_AJECA|nr:hypothetical protein I7I52_06792 [Histoplasma capsulatum]QSS74197.1 hypothetical protein I7I50_09271 [Histoplasma capsulatum G186AR]
MTSQPAPDIRQRGQPTNKSRPVSPLRQHPKNENNKLGEARYTSSRRRRPYIKMKPNPEFKQCLLGSGGGEHKEHSSLKSMHEIGHLPTNVRCPGGTFDLIYVFDYHSSSRV